MQELTVILHFHIAYYASHRSIQDIFTDADTVFCLAVYVELVDSSFAHLLYNVSMYFHREGFSSYCRV